MRATLPVNYAPPNPAGLCGQAWAYFATQAANGKPVVSKHLPTVAVETGFNLGNLKCELSRFNRYQSAKLAGALVAPTRGTRAVTLAAPVVQLGAVVAPATPQTLAALFFTPSAQVEVEVEAESVAPAQVVRKNNKRKTH